MKYFHDIADSTGKGRGMRFARINILGSILLAAALFSCGGGGSSGPDISLPNSLPDSQPKRTLSWDPPTQYIDNSVIGDPTLELKEYWIYVKSDNTVFTPTDNYVIVPAVDPVTNQLVTTFDLSSAASAFSLKQGIRYYVAMRVVSKEDIPSDFTDPNPDFIF